VESIVGQYAAGMVSDTVTVENKNGIHLRLAHELVKAASMFRSEITITKDDQEANAKSILGLAGLGAEFGSVLTITVDGVDEDDALSCLVELFKSKFQKKADG
jgi:phosphocarrier protein HPr